MHDAFLNFINWLNNNNKNKRNDNDIRIAQCVCVCVCVCVWIPFSYFNLHNVVNTESSYCADKSILFKTLLDVIGVITFNELSCTCFKDYVSLPWMIQLHLLQIKFLYKQSKTILPWTKGMRTKTQSSFQDVTLHREHGSSNMSYIAYTEHLQHCESIQSLHNTRLKQQYDFYQLNIGHTHCKV